ncbi:MAG: glycosyltransferase family 2 protein [Candidatus Cloacimonetes bacterium]|nr:glycosyltransferase family 2 protein [Candidatus Cloacimonadota bacterium]
MKVYFFSSLFLLIYHLFLYGILLQIVNIFKSRKSKLNLDYLPSVTILAAAYNEEKKIDNLLTSFANVDYPEDLINLLIVSDDSTDSTNDIVQKYSTHFSNIRLKIQHPRGGKASALNLIEPFLKTEIIISADASSYIQKDSIKKLVRYFADEKIGLVSGQMILKQEIGTSQGEGIYWKYESWLRKNESDLYSLIVASGCLFAMRRSLYKQVHPSSPDDFERTLITLKNGYLAVLEPSAIVFEKLTSSPKDEIRRKIRIISTEWFALFRNLELLNPFKFPIASFFLFSHKIIRWLLPILSFGLLFPCFFFLDEIFFQIFFIIQVTSYIIAILELYLEKIGKPMKLFKFAGYWLAMNVASLFALIKFISGKQQRTWKTN